MSQRQWMTIVTLSYAAVFFVGLVTSSSITDELDENAEDLVKHRHRRAVAKLPPGPVAVVAWNPYTKQPGPGNCNACYPRDCADLYDQGFTTSGVYTIYIGRKKRPVKVYCDMTTNGGGWTVLQRRINGNLNFYQPWISYANGFGTVSSEYWIGNEIIHTLTLDKQQTLRVDLSDFQSATRYAEYTDFRVGGACEKYKLLSVGTYCGNAGDALTYHVGQQFSTYDQDNDADSGNCAASYKGAWWHKSCHNANLNGNYLSGPTAIYAEGVVWKPWLGYYYSLKTSQMKIRPADFNT